jgi:tRNA pseudouridine55 synthase
LTVSDLLPALEPAPSNDHGTDGALIIDKPRGLTSHDVVAALRRALGVSRIGHTGTLDPIATGVLPVLLGRATRLARFVSGADKTYEARVRLTCETDTDDETGTAVTETHERRLERSGIEAALADFRGSFLQMPPAYSAKKVAGRRAYSLARRSVTPALEAAPVTVHRIELLDWQPPVVTLHIDCSAGFYVRALARDLGRVLGTGGHLAALRRIRSGQFRLEDAAPLDLVLQAPEPGLRRLVPPTVVVNHLPAVSVAGAALERAIHGRDIDVTESDDMPALASGRQHVRLVGPGGVLVGIAEPGARPGSLHPVVVVM